MNPSVEPVPSPSLTQVSPSWTDPPSLRRCAPGRIDLVLKSGRCPAALGGKVHLRAGQPCVVQVVPQKPTARVDIVPEQALQAVVPVSRIDGGPVPVYHAEFSGRSLFRIVPLPRTGRVHISVADGQAAPCRVIIPVAVWPRYSTYALWWVLAFLGLVAVRWQKVLAGGQSYTDMMQACWADLPLVLGLLPLGLLIILVVLWPLGLVISLTGWGESGE